MVSLRTNIKIRSFIALVFLSYWYPSSDAADTITNTQPLTTWEALFSPKRVFVMSFFNTPKTSNSSNFYLGIWLADDTLGQAVWVANRKDPIHSSSPSVNINDSGNLVISSDGRSDIPITNATWTSTNTSVRLLDNGNLVLLEDAHGDSREGHVLWQSFDHPTDTLLPGMKFRFLTTWLNTQVPYPGPFTLGIDPNGSNQFVIWYRGVVYWRSRLWNTSEDVVGFRNSQPYNIHYRFESDEDGKYFIYTINQTAGDDNLIYKWVMTSSAQISRDEWNSSGSGGAWLEDVEPISPCNGTFEDDGCWRRAWPNCSHPNENDFSKDKVTVKFNMFDINSSIALSDSEFTLSFQLQRAFGTVARRPSSIRCDQGCAGGSVDLEKKSIDGFRKGKRTDLKKIMILGAGPIVIGQACEFDYSGTQACKALKEEGYEVVLINSNPATIMTDPDLAHQTYIAPMTPELVEQVLEKERPDAILPTMGGQTALNLAVALAENGALERYGVELIGAKLDAIKKAEDRDLFKQAMENIGLKTPPSGIGTTLEECVDIANSIGEFPLIIRPAFTLGGTGGGIAYNWEEFENICKSGLAASLTSQVLVEKSLLGWKEYELEVMRDLADNVVIICSIENIDPMGVHTGDSITVAPAQTLTDKEYQRLRDYSVVIIREIGVECGGSNVQFAVNPEDGEVMVIEMNPRVSRSSALASKATGFPIAKMAAKLSIGYTLDQIPNDITKKTPASFEPSIDYVVTKIPRFAFEKFPGSQPILTTQMKSVGESMALGRTFQESFQKAVRSLECGYYGWGCAPIKELDWDWDQLKYSLRVPSPERTHAIYAAMKKGMKVDEIHELSFIDKWFLSQLKELVDVEHFLLARTLPQLTKDDFYEVKKRGFSDKQIAFATSSTESEVRYKRLSLGVVPAYKRVDTCAAEFEANTPYMYSSYDYECESAPSKREKVLILGGGPNRIGQGIEFDYCCCHASFALREAGYETIMMNSNPETVSTDYDTSDRLYFEPLTVEDVLNIIDLERPAGIIVQFGGQTPLKLALPIQRYLDEHKPLSASGKGHVRILGTTPDSIDAAEDRERFNAILKELGIEQPKGGIAKSEANALSIAMEIGYPVVVRPSYVLGGRAMEIVYNDEKLVTYLENAVKVDPERPVLIDRYLSDACEIDVDALADSYGNVVIGGIMEHIEQAGVHSGDSACLLPTKNVSAVCLETIRSWTSKLAKRLNVCGLMNCQYAISASGEVFLLEANPRASRTVPFVSKAIGHPLAKYASLVMSGKSIVDLEFTKEVIPSHVSVKEAVLPFEKFQGCDVLLGPEMRSTGEVMGIDFEFPLAFAKAQIAAGQKLPASGTVFLSLNDLTKRHLPSIAKAFVGMGFKIVATSGTAHVLELEGIPVGRVLKLHEGRPHAADMITNGQIQLMVITSSDDALDQIDGRQLRRMALAYKVPIITTVAGALASVEAIGSMKHSSVKMIALQDFFDASTQEGGSRSALQPASSTSF